MKNVSRLLQLLPSKITQRLQNNIETELSKTHCNSPWTITVTGMSRRKGDAGGPHSGTPGDVFLSLFCGVSPQLRCTALTFAFQWHPFVWPDTQGATGWQAEQDGKGSHVLPRPPTHLPCHRLIPLSTLFYVRNMLWCIVLECPQKCLSP